MWDRRCERKTLIEQQTTKRTKRRGREPATTTRRTTTTRSRDVKERHTQYARSLWIEKSIGSSINHPYRSRFFLNIFLLFEKIFFFEFRIIKFPHRQSLRVLLIHQTQTNNKRTHAQTNKNKKEWSVLVLRCGRYSFSFSPSFSLSSSSHLSILMGEWRRVPF